MTDRRLLLVDLGRLAYADALSLQRDAARARLAGTLRDDLLLLVEHPPVITLGRATKEGNLLANASQLALRGLDLFEVERGGDVTFHGPGQIVGYPIIDLAQHTQDLHWYLRQLEETMIRALASFGITASRNPGKTGVWVDGRKVTIPGYLMARGEEEKIAYNGASPFNNELHPLRVDAPKVAEARARRLAREARREREDEGRGGGRGGRGGGGGRGFPRKASRVMEKVKEVADVVAADVPALPDTPTDSPMTIFSVVLRSLAKASLTKR